MLRTCSRSSTTNGSARILELLPPVQRRRLRALLGYDPLTAGGLMSPDFVAVYTQATQEEALDRVRRAVAPSDALAWIFTINTHRRYRGAVSLPDLVRAGPGDSDHRPDRPQPVRHRRSRPRRDRPRDDRLRPDDRPRRRRATEHPIGIITIDDVLELIAPPPGRGFGIFGGS